MWGFRVLGSVCELADKLQVMPRLALLAGLTQQERWVVEDTHRNIMGKILIFI